MWVYIVVLLNKHILGLTKSRFDGWKGVEYKKRFLTLGLYSTLEKL